MWTVPDRRCIAAAILILKRGRKQDRQDDPGPPPMQKSLPQGELVDQSVARKGTAQARLKGQDLSMPCLLMWEGVVRPDGLGLNSGTSPRQQ
jgi:hypothetical protein